MRKTLYVLLVIAGFALQGFAQNTGRVTGKVTDAENGDALIGVSVTVEGMSIGTATDVEGGFTLDVPQGKSLVFSYIGYRKQTVAVRGTSAMAVRLSPDVQMLEEVVAIGYGSMKKSDLTGAVGSISGEKLRAAPVARVDQALQGRLAGVTVNSNSGQPGADATIRIRGVGTVNSASPVYVVDGIITDNINFLSTSDIASLEVLKDASAQAIYGSRGANGVILITTKTGNTTGKSNVTFESYVGSQNRWRKLDVMRRDAFVDAFTTMAGTASRAKYERDGLNEWIRTYFTPNTSTYYPRVVEYNADGTVRTPGIDYTSYDTDWQDEVFVKDALMQNYYLSVDGGSDKAKYLISSNYFDQNGTLIGSYYNRLTLRVNTEFEVKDWLTVGEHLSFTNSHSRNIQGNGNTALIASALSMAPWDPMVYPEGSLSGHPRPRPQDQRDLSGNYSTPSLFRNVIHPYNQVFNGKPDNNSEDWVGDLYVEIRPFKGLTLRGDVNTKLWYEKRRNFTPVLDVQYNAITRNGVSASMTRSQQLTYEGTATYNTLFAGKHDLTVMFGATTEEYNSYSVSASGSELVNTAERNWYIGQTPDEIRTDDTGALYHTRSGGDSVSKSMMAALLGRLHYVYDNKYLFTFNFRRDGAAKLPKNARWDFFPSFAAAWKINEESFFEPLRTSVDFLKLRVGWGQIGNVNALGSLDFMEKADRNSTWMYGYAFGVPNVLASGMSMTGVPPGLVWERTEQTDFGLDFGLFNNLLYGNIDLYRRDTKDMIMPIVPPGNVGYRYNPKGNAATVRNQGLELNLEHQKRFGAFSYSLGGNIAFVHNELIALNEGEPLYDGIIMSDEGYGLHTIFVREYTGVFQNQAEVDAHSWTDPETGASKLIQPDAKPGDARYADRNNDGQITDADRFDAGNPFPDLTYGFNAQLYYKGFDFQVFFQGVNGNEVYNYLRQNKLETEGYSALSTDMKNVFFPVRQDPADATSPWINGMPGSNGSIPNPTATGSVENKSASTRFVEDASYLRLKNIQLGYTLPRHITGKIGVDRLRIYIGANNLWTVTKYKGYDPEVGNSGRDPKVGNSGRDPEVGNSGRDYGNFPQARTLLAGLSMNF
ncbi:MAG: TonB-dependent receptor [Dysgonamonadaceae bacterium]|jgi:TonB-linked SusC/RagA family outer membrane protein|nr:TonB-dependent receptor [Dysgonamonadaceae bacterium]